MVDVTVLGAGSTTVTIALSSAQNAAAAQTAINFVNKQTLAGIVDQQTWTGVGTLPAPQNILGGAIVTIPGDVGALSAQYISVAVNAAGKSTVIGPQNFNSTVVAGDTSALTYGNVSSNGQIFFGNADSTLINFAGTANVAAGTGNYVVETDKGATTNFKATGGLVVTHDIAGVSGATHINVADGANVTVVAQGSATVPVTINANTGSLFVNSQDTSNTVINPGAANVTVAGGTVDSKGNRTSDGGRVTLFGGTGSVLVGAGMGEFTGGTAGNNQMFSSTVAGSATLTGGGTGDVLYALGKNQLLIAGAGSETLVGNTQFSTGPSTYIVGNGFATVFGGGQGGNTYLFSGLGSGLIDGRDETAKGAPTANSYVEFGSNPGGTHLIGDFVTKTDTLATNGSDYTLTFFAAGATGSPFGADAGTEVKLTNGTTYQFFDTNKDGVQDIFASDITGGKQI